MPGKKLVQYLADLSKISFSPEEIAVMTEEMNQIVGLMDTIKVVELSSDLQDHSNDLYYTNLREDASKASDLPKQLLENAAISKDEFFVVPKVVE